jgi:diguanylate cyclase (GGDEF)-like protein
MEQGPYQRFKTLLQGRFDPSGETSEDHRDRLFLQVQLSLAAHVIALLVIFYLLLPLTAQGKDIGSLLLWSALAAILSIIAIFLNFGHRNLCVNLLLTTLSLVLVGSSFVLGGVMSPTMIFLLAMPVLASTLTTPRWAFCWTAITVGSWLLILVLENNGFEMRRITLQSNVASVQVLSFLGTALVVMSVLGSYVAANSRLRVAMETKTERLDYLASYDSLTAIPNRRALFEHADQCLRRAKRSSKPFALLMIDLNQFKQINDTLGHKTGDAILQHFAQRLKRSFRDTDFIGRIGGDEFGVVLEPVENIASVKLAVERLLNDGQSEAEVEEKRIPYTFATGIALYPEDGQQMLDLYEKADAAMYRSKRNTPEDFIWR